MEWHEKDCKEVDQKNEQCSGEDENVAKVAGATDNRDTKKM